MTTRASLNAPRIRLRRPSWLSVRVAIAGGLAGATLFAASPAPATDYACPVGGLSRFTDTFGARRSGGRGHQGVDMLGDQGTPLVAVTDGVVESAKHSDSGSGGITLWLRGDDGTSYYYAHNLRNLVGQGTRVTRGQQIALRGKTGNARRTSPHLHFEIHPGGRRARAVNPTQAARQWCPGQGG